MRSSHWATVVRDELKVLSLNNTWRLTTLLGGRFPIGCKLLFKINRNSDGTVARYKARLVANRLSQKLIFYFQDTFSLVVKSPTVRIILTLARTHKRCLRQVDVNNALRHGELSKEVYMTQPSGFKQCDESRQSLIRT